MVDVVSFERDSLFPKHHLPYEVRVIRSSGSAIASDVELLWRTAQELGDDVTQAVHRMLGVRYRIELRETASRESASPLQCQACVSNAKHVFVARACMPWSSLGTADQRQDEVRSWLASLVREPYRVLVPDTIAVQFDHVPQGIGGAPVDGESLNWDRVAADALTVDVTLREPGIVVISEVAAPGWTVSEEVHGQPVRHQVIPVNLVMQGIPLPAGEHHLQWRYAPRSVTWGGMTTIVTIVGGTIVLILLRQGGNRRDGG